MKTTTPVEPKIYNHTEYTLGQIKSMELIGINRNNWSNRTIHLHKDPVSDLSVLTIGYRDDKSIVISREVLAESMNFRIAIDYWKHGKKIYTRD